MAAVTTADTARSEIRYAPETTWAERPASGSLKRMRFTGESLRTDRQTVTSSEIRADRQITDLVATRTEASGGISGEFSFGTYDDFLESAMYGAWEDNTHTATTISINSSKHLSLPAGHGLDMRIGTAIQVSGFATVANNGIWVVESVETANRVYGIRALDGTTEPTAEAAGQDVTVKESYLINGTTQKSFYLDKHFADVGDFIAFDGMIVSNFSLSLESEALITVEMSFMGRQGESKTSSPIGGTVAAATVTQIMNAGRNVGHVVSTSGDVSQISRMGFTIENNLRLKPAVSQGAGIGIGAGRINVTGNLVTYFEDLDLYDKFQANDSLFMRFVLERDGEGAYLFHMPRIKLSEMQVPIGGPDQDIFSDGSYQAIRDPDTGYTVAISRMPA